ncbi:MAG: hypothetical protein MJ106_04055, partial [Lentisphaeria bacterium]|nr:hypothetical protein [Lentisphaeria bacterium]
MRKVLFLLCCIAFALLAGQKAEWIIYPENPAEGVNKERYLRTEFEVAQKPIRRAMICYVIDDDGHVFLNGKDVRDESKHMSVFPLARHYDITHLISAGRNALSVIAINAGGNGGTMLRIEITYKDDSIQEVFSDTTWKTSTEKAEGWEMAGFDDHEWQTPKSNGDYNADPWVTIYDMVAFYAHDDVLVELARRRQNGLKKQQLLKQLAKEPAEQAKVTYKNGSAFFDIGG